MTDNKEIRFEPGLKLARHKELVEYLNDKFVSPINVEISPSGICNANCPKCFYSQKSWALPGRDKEFFEENRMKDLIKELSDMGVKSISYTGGGEPTLHPSFPKFVKWANMAGLEQGLFTNALKPIKYDPTLFEWIRVTKTNHNLNEKVLETIRPCKTVGICVNYSKEDLKGVIEDTLKIGEKLDNLKTFKNHSTYVQVRPALEIKGGLVELIVPSIKHPLLTITDYKFLGSGSERDYNLCEAYHFTPFVWQNGDVDVCAYHKGEKEFNLGNLYVKGKQGRFKTIMKDAPSSIEVKDNCQICCKLNGMNSTINHMRKLKDVNFP